MPLLRNLKIISSILYYSIIELFTDLPKISKDLKPINDDNQKKKTVFSTKKNTDSSPNVDKIIEEKKKKYVKYDPGYDKSFNNFLVKSNDDVNKKEDEIIITLNGKLPNYSPDTLVDQIEFLQEKMFPKDEVKDFFELCKKNNYSLSSKIKGWSERLHGLVIKEIDDINGDDNNDDNNNSNFDD